MLISTNKKNNIAKSIALMLALVLAFSCILTACADKTARKDVEDLKATVDTLGKDVDTVEGVANSAVTNDALTKALADALAKYLDKEGHDADIAALLKEYTKTGEAEKFVTDLLKGYYTQAQIDEMLKGYYTKTEVETLVSEFITKEDVPGFIAEYLATPEAKDAIAELLDDTYMDLGDWNAATAEVMTAIANVSAALGALDDDIFTVADYEKFVELVETAFEVYIDVEEEYFNYEQLMIDIIRATDPSEFDYLEQLAKDTADLDAASEAIEAINAKIKALQTASAGKIDTDDKAALDEIKAAIVAFDAKYGFNATTITVDVATEDFLAAFCGTAMDETALKAKLVVNATVPDDDFTTADRKYNTNSDYVTTGGLKINDYITMQERYDFLMAWAAEIDAMIVELVAEIGEDQSISDDQLALIQDVMDEVRGDAGFVAANNTITTPIKGWNTYVYYEWLAGKRIFDDDKIDAKAELDAYASELADKFESSQMNADNATLVKNAKEYLDELMYASFKSYVAASEALETYIAGVKADMYENFAKYSFNDTQLKAVETIETMKEALTADKYDTVVELADDYIEALEAIAPVLDDETVEYPWTAALNALNAKKTEAVTAINLAKAKIDAKEVVMAYAELKLYGDDETAAMFTGDEKNFNDIEAFIKAAAKATDADIDAVTDIANIDAAILAAKGKVDVEVYNQMLNLAKAAVQTTVMGIAKDAKNYDVDYTAIGALANTTVINAYAVVITVDTNNSTETTLDDTLAGAYSIALEAVNKCGADFNDADIVKAYLDLVRV